MTRTQLCLGSILLWASCGKPAWEDANLASKQRALPVTIETVFSSAENVTAVAWRSEAALPTALGYVRLDIDNHHFRIPDETLAFPTEHAEPPRCVLLHGPPPTHAEFTVVPTHQAPVLQSKRLLSATLGGIGFEARLLTEGAGSDSDNAALEVDRYRVTTTLRDPFDAFSWGSLGRQLVLTILDRTCETTLGHTRQPEDNIYLSLPPDDAALPRLCLRLENQYGQTWQAKLAAIRRPVPHTERLDAAFATAHYDEVPQDAMLVPIFDLGAEENGCVKIKDAVQKSARCYDDSLGHVEDCDPTHGSRHRGWLRVAPSVEPRTASNEKPTLQGSYQESYYPCTHFSINTYTLADRIEAAVYEEFGNDGNKSVLFLLATNPRQDDEATQFQTVVDAIRMAVGRLAHSAFHVQTALWGNVDASEVVDDFDFIALSESYRPSSWPGELHEILSQALPRTRRNYEHSWAPETDPPNRPYKICSVETFRSVASTAEPTHRGATVFQYESPLRTPTQWENRSADVNGSVNVEFCRQYCAVGAWDTSYGCSHGRAPGPAEIGVIARMWPSASEDPE